MEFASMDVEVYGDRDRYEGILDFMEAVSCRILTCLSAHRERTTLEEEAAWVEAIAALARERGILTCYHPRTMGVTRTFAEACTFYERTDPELVFACLETGHSTKDFDDLPLKERSTAYVDAFGDRIRLVEAKDWNAQTDLNTPAGEGEVDWHGVRDRLVEHNYDGWVLAEQNSHEELSKGRSYEECARISLDFLRNLFNEKQ
jgi:sugar phosphate isomerase/epimerase